MDSKRILITGISHYWGGRLAQALEAFPEIEAVIGVDNEEPQVELERTEYVKVGAQHALLRRVVEAAEIDTVVDTRLVVDSATTSSSKAHENNVMGTMNILAACSGSDSPVKKVVFKSSTHFYGCHQYDPAFFDETMRRPHPPTTGIERDIVEAEASLNEFGERHPDTAVSVLRFANVLGPDVETSHIKLFSLPVVPMILGFDPRYQFVHEDDVVHALEHAVKHRVPGTYNVAGDGVLALSEVAGLLGKPYAPVLPPWGTGIAASVARRVGVEIPPEALNQMRYGRGVDNRRFKAGGFHYQHTSRETVMKLGEHLRLHPVVRGAQEPYRYEREVEDFLRWSPHVKNTRDKAVSALSRAQLSELQRLLTSFADTAGMDLAHDIPDRAAEAEKRAAAAEEAAREAAERAAGAEKAAERRAKTDADELAAERRAREDAERRGEDAETRAREDAEKRAREDADARAREDAERRAREEAETRAREDARRRAAGPPDHYDDLAAEEVIALLASLEQEDLQTLREYERDHANRTRVLSAIDSVLARRGSRV
jgi:UDP-glucose 4-epimerase